jgi:hypothetical protein
MILKREQKERVIENYLNHYRTYKIGIKNCQKQLDYIMPSLTARYEDGAFYIANNTERVALDRIASKHALDLLEQIEQHKVIVSSIDAAIEELDELQAKFVELRYFRGLKMYQVENALEFYDKRTLYRIRKSVLEKFLISLNNLISLK